MAMAAVKGKRVVVVGAGMAGLAIARMLGPHCSVRVLEQRPDVRKVSRAALEFSGDARRSIGVLLSKRGARVMQQAGLPLRDIDASGVRVKGREVHAPGGGTTFVPWGKPEWSLLSTDRQLLGVALLEGLEEHVDVSFDAEVCRADVGEEKSVLAVKNASGQEEEIRCDLVIGADGVNSVVRRELEQPARCHALAATVERQSFQYKNLLLPPAADGSGPRLVPDRVHTWPGHGALLHAMPSKNDQFTCTLILPRDGEGGFSALQEKDRIRTFFGSRYPEALELIPDLVEQFVTNPTGNFYTVYCDKHHYKGGAVIIGDAAHATVPFAGQGLNCALEDAQVLYEYLMTPDVSLAEALLAYSAFRLPDAHAMVKLSKAAEDVLCKHQGDLAYLRRTKYQQLMSMLWPSRYPSSLYAMLDFHGDGQSVRYSAALAQFEKQNLTWRYGRM